MFGSFIPMINGVMDGSALQRNTIADNIANANTPDYKAQKVRFDNQWADVMSLSLSTEQAHHLPKGGKSASQPYEVVTDSSTKARADGNNVDTTTEMIDMIRNNYIFNTSVQALNKEFSLHKVAIGRA